MSKPLNTHGEVIILELGNLPRLKDEARRRGIPFGSIKREELLAAILLDEVGLSYVDEPVFYRETVRLVGQTRDEICEETGLNKRTTKQKAILITIKVKH